jgi:phosphoribosyl 1,2-cyclic phosphate phosphodiesterase
LAEERTDNKHMKLLFLGTGTSTGIPQIGCQCKTCQSSDRKDKRLRASLLVNVQKTNILIDAGPDLREQLLTYQISKLSGILLTHEHYDHIGGIDDLRPLGESHLYAEKRVLNIIQKNMPYCFGDNLYPGVPMLQLHEITEKSKFYIDQVEIQAVRVMHAKLPILGFRIGNIAYLTDVKTLDNKAIEQLQYLDLLVINALRQFPHISHLSLQEAIELSEKINAKETYFTHISHDMGKHADVEAHLPSHIHLAYDGLEIEIN